MMGFGSHSHFECLLLILLTHIVLFSSSLSSYASLPHLCHDDQKSILLQFMDESLSEYDSKIASWKPDTDCCSWAGIKCDNATGHVIGLDLSNCDIHGINNSKSSLFKLHTLQSLDLSDQSLFSSDNDGEKVAIIPNGFARLSRLTYLNLSRTYFHGKVPLQMSRLTKLEYLDLSFTAVSLSLERLIKNMSSLRVLYLDGVDMSTHNSNWCDALSSAVPNLVKLSLSDCAISGPIHSSLSNLHLLSEIDLSGNPLSSEVPQSLVNMSSLVTINLQDCQLHGEFPANVFRLPRLQEIDLSQNPGLQGSLPEFPHHNSALRNMEIRSSNFHGSVPSSIGNLSQLQILDLSSNNFSGKIPDSIVNLTALTYLDLSSNNFSGSIPSLILPTNNITRKFELEHPSLSPDNITGLLCLTCLDFSENSLEGIINYSLFILPSLEFLYLQMNAFQALPAQVPYKPSPFLSEMLVSDNILQGHIPGWIAQLTSLSILDLSSNEFNGSLDLDVLSNLTNLGGLYLSDNYLSVTASPNSTFPQLESFESRSCNLEEFPPFLRNTWLLFNLDMSNNKIKGKIPRWIWTSPLRRLNLSSNFLTGLEEPFPNASILEIFDLHSNELRGSLPLIPQPAIFFSVSGNSLVGKIPTSICNASELEVLDLSNNNLIGPIPSCVGSIDYLSVINLGGNSLKGTMPQFYAASLTTLVLNGNRLEGKVPWSLYGCKKLEVLDLGNNQIHDVFPSRLENLLQLRVLVLRSNRFYGQIKGPRTKKVFPMLLIKSD